MIKLSSKKPYPWRVFLMLQFFIPWLAASMAESEEYTTDSYDNQTVLEEVIVTARKRQEVLQDTPVAVSALTSDALRAAGIANTRDLEQAVPGLNFSEMGNKAPAIFIRGVGQKESLAALDPGVGVYINSIFIARTDSQLLDVVDTQSIQVLRGPQGTLFGKNNVGGALIVTTQQPHTEALAGEISTRLGNLGRRDLKLSTNIPLNDETLAVRFSLNSTKREGYLTSTYNGDKYGDEERLGATARLYWQASDVLSADIFYYWSKIDERGAGFTCVFQNKDGVFSTFQWPGFEGDNGYAARCLASESIADDNKILDNGPSVYRISSQILGLTLSWEYDDFEIKSITAWSQQDDIVIEDDSDATDISGVGTGTIALMGSLQRSLDAGYGNFSLPDDEERYQFSQELQMIGSAFDESLSYTVGLFAAKEVIHDNIYSNLVGPNGYSYKADVLSLIPKIIGTLSDLTNNTYAVFGQATYDVTDWYQLTLGTRYTIEKRERIATLYETDCEAIFDSGLIAGADNLCAVDVLALADPSGYFANPPEFMPIRLVDEYLTLDDRTITAVNGKVRERKKWSRWTPTITNSFNVPEEYLEDSVLNSTLIYFTYSKGFKSGGFEMKGLEIAKFEPEDLSNYELGIKIDAFDERIRFNTAIYYMDYDEIQIRITEQGRSFADILLFIDNAGEATIKGIEMELTALPLSNVIINATANYTDASYDKFIATNVDTAAIPPVQSEVDRHREEFAAVPKVTYSLAVMVNWPTAIGQFTPRLSLYYRDSLYTGLDSLAWDSRFRDRTTIDDMVLWNFRLAFTPVNNVNIQLALFIDNLADTDYFQGGFSNTESFGAGSFVKGTPRTYGLEATFGF